MTDRMTRAQLDAWWQSQPAETREMLDSAARSSLIDGLPRYPYWAPEICAELLAWSQLENEVAGMYTEWLLDTRAKFDAHGWPWTTAELARRSQLGEVE